MAYSSMRTLNLTTSSSSEPVEVCFRWCNVPASHSLSSSDATLAFRLTVGASVKHCKSIQILVLVSTIIATSPTEVTPCGIPYFAPSLCPRECDNPRALGRAIHYVKQHSYVSCHYLPILSKSRRPKTHPRRDLKLLPCVNIIGVCLRLRQILE
jgi:hypothetical protein